MEVLQTLTYHLSSNEFEENGTEYSIDVRICATPYGDVIALLDSVTVDGKRLQRPNPVARCHHWAFAEDRLEKWATDENLQHFIDHDPAFAPLRVAHLEQVRADLEWHRRNVL